MLLRNRDYLLLWGGQVVSTIGSTASGVVYPLLILAITGSPEAAGVAGALRALPYLVLSLPAGALIDRWDRKRVMIVCDLGRAVAVASVPVALAFDALTLTQIYAATLIEGSLFVLFNIAEVAALPRVVTTAELPQAAAQNEAGFAAASIAGPSFGTALYQWLGRGAPFVADALSYVVSVLSLVAIRKPFRDAPAALRRNLHVEIAEGLVWLWRNRLVRYIAFLTGGYNLVNAALPLILIVLAKELGAGDAAVGILFSVASVGGIVGSLIGGQIQRRFTFGQVIIGTAWINLLLFPLFVLAPSWIWLGVIAALIATLGPVYNVVQFSYRLSLIPDELQGRVNSTFRLLAFGFMPVGAALSGVLIERFDARIAVLVLTAGLVVLTLATSFNRDVRGARPIGRTAAA